jgi:hypothetical protein
MELDGACAMSSATDFETYARDCVKLAEQAHAPPELREQLLQMAREWMQAMMEAEDRAAKDDAITVQMLGEAHREIRESAAISPQR